MRGGSVWHTILLLILASVIIGVIQLAFIFLVFAGLIFRTRETVGALTLLFALSLIDRYPWAGIAILALITLLALLQSKSEAADAGTVQLLPESTGAPNPK
jgi:hypothetical protein